MSLKKILCSLGAVLAAIAVTLFLLVLVELFSAVVHPMPQGFEGTKEEVCAHVANYPQWVLAVVIPMWGGIAFVGTWIAERVGTQGSAVVIGTLLLLAVIVNVAMLPYPIWFKILQPIVILLATLFAVRTSGRRKIAISEADLNLSADS